jgi:hypothetical protein
MAAHPVVKGRFAGRWLLLASLLLALVGALARTPAAHAAFSSCRADPIFILSDGTILDVQVGIATSVSNVDEIHYVVHGPKGVKLIAALATPTLGFDGLETVTYVADQAANKYVTDTLVRTAVSNVETTSYTTFAGNGLLSLNLRLSLQYHEIEGWAGQHLVAYLTK